MRERILIVEDNKALSKLIAMKMEESVDMDVVVAHTLEDAKNAIEENDDFFLALLDLNLPDAPNGEIVDYVLSQGIKVIVLTGSMDKETQEIFTKKDIIDYIIKSNLSNISYIFDTINRLSRNRKYKAMVVDNDMHTREQIKKVLKLWQFNVFAANHGEEALSYLQDNPDIKLIITASNMPAMNGFDMLLKIREKNDQNKISIVVMLKQDELEEATKYVKNGANDIITKPFSMENLICRINNSIEVLEYKDLVNKYYSIDYLTKLPNRTEFYTKIKKLSKQADNANKNLVVAIIKIDDFGIMNFEQGYENSNLIIEELSQVIMKHLGQKSLVARFGKNEFIAALYGDEDFEETVKTLVELRASVAAYKFLQKNNKNVNITISIGVASGRFDAQTEFLVNNAERAWQTAEANGKNRVEIS